MVVNKYFVLRKYLILIITLFFSYPVFSAGISLDIKKTEYLNAVISTVDSSLPDIESVVPGYKPTKINRHKILINNFHGDKKDEFALGYALGEVLRFDVSSYAGDKLYMPGYYLFARDWNAVFYHVNNKNSLAGIDQLAKMWGVNYAVSGTIKIIEGKYKWKLNIIEVNSNKIVNSKNWEGGLSNISYALNQARKHILLTFLGNNAKGTGMFSMSSINDFDSLEKYGEFLVYRLDNDFEAVSARALELWESGFRKPAVGVSLMHKLTPRKDTPDFYGNMMSSIENAFDHPHLKTLNLYKRAYHDTGTRRKFYIDKLSQLVEAHPDDPIMLISLAWILAKRGYELKAFALTNEVISRWPELHRGWEVASSAAFKYSWFIRGNDYWKDVSVKAKQQFLALQKLADVAAENCYSASGGHPTCIIAKMLAQNGYSYELLQLFNEIIEIEPHNYYAYSIPLDFSARKWGGSVKKQEYILEKARLNNPDADWVEDMRKELAPDVKVPTSPILVFMLIIIALIVLFVGFILYRKMND